MWSELQVSPVHTVGLQGSTVEPGVLKVPHPVGTFTHPEPTVAVNMSSKAWRSAGGIDRAAAAFVEPAGHVTPALHAPLQVAAARPVMAPYLPAGHSVQSTTPVVGA